MEFARRLPISAVFNSSRRIDNGLSGATFAFDAINEHRTCPRSIMRKNATYENADKLASTNIWSKKVSLLFLS